MNPGRSPLELRGTSEYCAPPTDHGRLGSRTGRLWAREASDFLENDLSEEASDSVKVSKVVQTFMGSLYDDERYAKHNARLLDYYAHYADREDISEEDHAAIEINRMAIELHDMVDHGILNAEKTASKLGLEPEEADDIRNDALASFNEILNQVGDQDGLIKAYLFAIDASKWESAAQIWRQGANERIEELEESTDDDKMQPYSAKIVKAAVNKTALLDSVGTEELTRVLKANVLVDLKLGAISEGTLNHNIQGLFLKALETLDIIEHPPKDNPASTWRDCTEAINFFVPALATLGYRELAMDLRGAALKWLFDDPHGDAERQNAASEQYFDQLKEMVIDAQEQAFGVVEVATEQRVKTEGSIRAKLASKNYVDLHKVPDGIGFAFIVPDDMSEEEMEHCAQSYMEELTGGGYRIIAKHPNDDEEVFEKKEPDSGYRAIHMAFYYYPEDGPSDGVPFEIQVLTREQHRMKLYGEWSDLFYKLDTEFTPDDQPHLDRLAKRGQAEREMAPGSTIQSISEAIAVSPEIPFVFNKLFRSVDTAKGQRILVPPGLEGVVRELSDGLARELGESGNLTVLPAAKVSEGQFKDALNMFSRDLAVDKNILAALALVKQSEAGKKRADGVTPNLDGHILPVALSALMQAIQSGKIWDSDKLDPREYMSNIVTIALLHDDVEAALGGIEDEETIRQKRQDIIDSIQDRFDTDISEGVEAMTLPLEIKDQHERREQYRRNIQANGYARIIKPLDRWQNHVTDLIRLASGLDETDTDLDKEMLHEQFMDYFAKTDRHQSADFTSGELSGVYSRVHVVIWQIAEHFGYNQADNQR